MTISNGTTTTALQFTGTYTLADFHIANDGAGGTLLTDPPAAPGAVNNAPVSISNGEVLAIRNPHSGDVSFAGRTGTLWLDQPSSFTGTVSDFGAKDRNRPADDGLRFTNHGRLFTEEKRHRRHAIRIRRRPARSNRASWPIHRGKFWPCKRSPWWHHGCLRATAIGQPIAAQHASAWVRTIGRALQVTGTLAASALRCRPRHDRPFWDCVRGAKTSGHSQNSNREGCTLIAPLGHNYAVGLRYGERSPRRCSGFMRCRNRAVSRRWPIPLTIRWKV